MEAENLTRACDRAHAIFIEETERRVEREQAAATAPPQPPFVPLTAEKIREAANAIRAKQGLGPLPNGIA